MASQGDKPKEIKEALANECYTVGWICAVKTEYVAAQLFLDEKHGRPHQQSQHDGNDYTLGQIGKHKVVISTLPGGEYGTSAATGVARDMLHSFPNIRIGLMVGIAGGAPNKDHDIRLGDVVVSMPGNGESGVIYYDFGKAIQNHGLKITGHLDKPPTILRTAATGLQAEHEIEPHTIEEAVMSKLQNARLRKSYGRPDLNSDRLYQPTFEHHEKCCAEATGDENAQLVDRALRGEEEDSLVIHYGLIASGNKLMKDALVRDQLSAEHGILCFEMEAAGLMNNFPCLVIRGICDYSDTHKNKGWQGFAAMAAAAYARDLLYRIPPNSVEAQEKISNIVLSSLSRIEKDVEGVRYQLKKKYDSDILDWITDIDYGPQQSDFFNRRQPHTGQWFLDCPEYRTWLDEPRQTLFCPGIPGAGKTILSSIIVNDLYEKNSSDIGVGIAYVFCNFKRTAEQTVEGLLSSLLKQLSERKPSLPKEVEFLYNTHKTKRTRPSIHELSENLQSVIDAYSKVYLVIDALDECQISNDTRDKFLSVLFRIQSKTYTNILATSRFNLDVQDRFGQSVVLEIRASEDDIQRYISENMVHLPPFIQKSPQLEEAIQTDISNAVCGMFLLAKLYMDSLRTKQSIKDVRKALNSLTSGDHAYHRAYDEAMERIQGQLQQQTRLAHRVLSWITCAKRPLATIELQHALSVEIGTSEFDVENLIQTDMVSVCAGLVTIDERSGIIRLVHFTTEEYFQGTWRRWFPNAQLDLTETCVTYLSFKVFDSGCAPDIATFEDRMRSFPFYDYAADHWGSHVNDADNTSRNKAIFPFLRNKALVEAASQALLAKKSYAHRYNIRFLPNQWTGLHLTAYFGIEIVVESLSSDFRVDVINSSNNTPLHVAAEQGHEAVVKQLLDQGANLEAQDTDSRTPLHFAVDRGHKAVVKQLLDQGANLEAQDINSWTPLHFALKGGHDTVVKQLFDQGANLEARDTYNWTPLHFAVDRGYETVVKQLIDRGANLKARDTYNWTPLHNAAEGGHEAVVKQLLDHGANLEAQDKHSRTPLHLAVKGGHEAVVRQLIYQGANLEARDIYDQTPLWIGIENGCASLERLLSEYGASALEDFYGLHALFASHS